MKTTSTAVTNLFERSPFRKMSFLSVGIFVLLMSAFSETASLRGPWKRIKAKRSISPYPTPSAPLPDFDFMLSHSVPMSCPSSNGTIQETALTDSQLLELLHQNGGLINPNLVAVSRTLAETFPNMMSISQQSSEDEELDHVFNFDPVRDNEITKRTILEDLNSWSSLKTQLANEPITAPTTLSSTTKTRKEHVQRPTAGQIQESGTVSSALTQVQSSDQESAIIDHSMKSQLEELNKQIEGILRGTDIIGRQNLADMMNNYNITLHPRILQGLHSGFSLGSQRFTRSTDGTSTTIQYCRGKGNETSDGFLHMCSECAATTTLSKDKFPRYLNEVVCAGSDRTCLTVRGTPHGACKQNYIYVNMLRRRPGGCRIMIQNGHQVLVDAWEIYTQKIRAGCECFVDKRSLFAKYIGPFG